MISWKRNKEGGKKKRKKKRKKKKEVGHFFNPKDKMPTPFCGGKISTLECAVQIYCKIFCQCL
jgi:hypothetical protein